MMLPVTAKHTNLMDEYIGAVAVILVGIIGYLTGRRKNRADAADLITEAAIKLLEPLTKRVDELEKKVTCQDEQIKRYGLRVITLMRGIERLVVQITGLGHTPVWTPEEWSPDDEVK